MAENLILNLGAGGRPVPGYVAKGKVISVDLDGNADVTADVRSLPFDADYADVIFASHLLEHFPESELPSLLAEWKRVLKPGGQLVIEVPDIQSAAAKIAANGVDAILYEVNGLKIRGQDIIFGHAGMIAEGNQLMRHKVAFDKHKLARTLGEAGFTGTVDHYPEVFALLARVQKEK